MPRKCSVKTELKLCDKSSFATCDGCSQPFCLPHLITHQQELATQMERIVSDHDLLREDLNKHHVHPEEKIPDFANEFSLIDAWQTRVLAQATKIITEEADRARNVVRLIMNENQSRVTSNMVAISEESDRLKKQLAILSEQLQERMKASDYLEPDLSQWQDQLRDILKSSETPQVQTRLIVNELVVKETKQLEINVSDALYIQYEDPEKHKARGNPFESICKEELDVEDNQEEYSPTNTPDLEYSPPDTFPSLYPSLCTSQRLNSAQHSKNSATNASGFQNKKIYNRTYRD